MFTDTIGLALGEVHSLLLNQDGSVWSSGMDTDGQLGLAATKHVTNNFIQAISSGVKAVAAGDYHSIVLMHDHSVWTTGKNSKGQLGDTSRTDRNIFSPVKGVDFSFTEFGFKKYHGGAQAIAAGGYHSMVLTGNGGVWTTGWNAYGQLGSGLNNDRSTFITSISEGMAAIDAGEIHSMALGQDGKVWTTGGNMHGQLGDRTTQDRNRFVEVITGGAHAIAAGGYHSMVLMQNGRVLAAGYNNAGQLGDGMPTQASARYRNTFKVMRYYSWHQDNLDAKAIAAGSRHSMVLKEDGSVWATGYNRYGQLGDYTTNTAYFLLPVLPGGVETIAAGGFHSMVLNEDGSVWATGSNKYGQSGIGSETSTLHFVRVIRIGAVHIFVFVCMYKGT